MSKPSLSRIFRDHAGAGDLAEIDVLLALAHGERPADAEHVLAEIARSPLNGDLLRFARDLEPAAATLSTELATAMRESQQFHRNADAQRPVHGVARRWRVGAALAASLLAAVAVWNVQRVQKASPASAPLAQTPVAPDRIFASMNDRSTAVRGDEIFRAEFPVDKIFSWNEHGG